MVTKLAFFRNLGFMCLVSSASSRNATDSPMLAMGCNVRVFLGRVWRESPPQNEAEILLFVASSLINNNPEHLHYRDDGERELLFIYLFLLFNEGFLLFCLFEKRILLNYCCLKKTLCFDYSYSYLEANLNIYTHLQILFYDTDSISQTLFLISIY